jgi:hypothetical protein
VLELFADEEEDEEGGCGGTSGAGGNGEAPAWCEVSESSLAVGGSGTFSA